ncbi:hypothetical protein F6R97_26805 [Pseudomonas sp. JV414]|uniref:hypothetical protein n=1 Tax=Pseudomonas sp. JV414 TaxID=1733110 RepID=UPI0028E12BB3|nr:hypothetical protein [Pseudomonas sp. JV414]MDT9678133.1 hypothetical protein [Pseudomonas sp. JV414]
MTLDQHIQILNAISTWVAGVATLAAVVVSLHLARRADRVRVRISVGLRLVFAGDGTPAEEHVGFTIVNLGDRSVTVNAIGWHVGPAKAFSLSMGSTRSIIQSSSRMASKQTLWFHFWLYHPGRKSSPQASYKIYPRKTSERYEPRFTRLWVKRFKSNQKKTYYSGFATLGPNT